VGVVLFTRVAGARSGRVTTETTIYTVPAGARRSAAS